MIGKVIGALAGKRLARSTSGLSESGGLIAGAASAAVLKRLGSLGLIAAIAGGYAVMVFRDRKESTGTDGR